MKPHDPNIINRAGKALIKPLSALVANSTTEGFSRLFEAYWCALLGKGGGTGWNLDAEINAASHVIKTSSPVIFDVGANKGEWSLQIQRTFPDARVYLFEPQPACQQIIKDKNIPNSILIPKAVSSISHSVGLYTSGNMAEEASLHERLDSYFQHKVYTHIEVDSVTIDDIMEEYDLEQVDFMKMDIEGHELIALHGAARSLKENKIKALSFEFGSGNINSRTFFHDFWDLLHGLHYQIYRILPSSRLRKL